MALMSTVMALMTLAFRAERPEPRNDELEEEVMQLRDLAAQLAKTANGFARDLMTMREEVARLREDLEAERGRSTRYRVECESWRAWGLNHAQQQQAMWAQAQNAMQNAVQWPAHCNCVPARHDLLLRGQ